jgi:hypothetical protein
LTAIQAPAESLRDYWLHDPEAEEITYVAGSTCIETARGKSGPLSKQEVAMVGPAGMEQVRTTWEVGAVTLAVDGVPVEPASYARIIGPDGVVWAMVGWSNVETLGVVIAYRIVCVRQD